MGRSEAIRAPIPAKETALLPLLAAGVLLLVGGALAPARADEDEQRYREVTRFGSEVELGFLWNSDSSFQFGNYTGLYQQGFSVLGNVDALWRGLGSDDDARYVRLQGLNLGLQSRYVGAEYGVQGRYGLFFEYDQLPVFQSETAQTFFIGDGTESLRLPAGWVPGDGPAGMTLLDQSLYKLDVDHQRKRIGGGFSLVLPASLSFDGRYSYESKEGNKLVGATMGLTGGNPRAVVIPEPIDYVTQNFEAVLRYLGEKWQGSLGYYGSVFQNRNNLLRWEVPYLANAAWDPTAGFEGSGACVTLEGCGIGRKAQAPDNWFHQILAAGGVSLPHQTQVTLTTAFGWMLQDDDFLPYSVNANLAAETQAGAPTDGTDLAALPRTSLDGEIFTTVVDFKVASRPLPKLDTDVRYRFDNRENNTPRNTWFYIRNDSEDQNVADNSGQGRLNMPYSYTQHRVDADLGYEVWRRTHFTLGYTWTLTDRDFQEAKRVSDSTLRVSFNSRPSSTVSTRVNYAHSWRDGSYDANFPFEVSHLPGRVDDERATCLASGAVANGSLPANACPYENHPLVRKYYLANRERDEVRFLLTLLPREDLNVGLNLNWVNDQYDDRKVGLENASQVSPGIDIGYTPIERLSAHLFYTYQHYKTRQNGWSTGFSPVTDPFDQAVDPDFSWRMKDNDHTHTVGLGFDLFAIPYKLTFGADYLFQNTNGQTEFELGPRAFTSDPPVLPYPKNQARQHNVSVNGEYRFTENISMRAGYLFAYFNQTDWALDGLAPGDFSDCGGGCVIGTGQESEDYRNHVVSWSLVYRFW